MSGVTVIQTEKDETVRVEVVATLTDVKPARKLTRTLTLKF